MRIRSNAFAFRRSRWFLCGAALVALWACNARTLVKPAPHNGQVVTKHFTQSSNRQLDLLFLIDNSLSMMGAQMKLQQRLPEFMDVLAAIPGGLPDLHVAVISSSLGAGAFSQVSFSSCPGASPKDDDGSFRRRADCTALNAGENFIKAGPAGNNFTGPIADVFRCMAFLGTDGCGFEQQLASMRRALQRAADPNDPVNGGFLRPEAFLGVVMLTNEDDCSVPFDSELFDPGQNALSQPLGEYQSYRCNEFGHLCNGSRPPHDVTSPVTLQNCVSAEGEGDLIPVSEFVTFLKDLKGGDASKVFVAALSGATGTYIVQKTVIQPETHPEPQVNVRHSCQGLTPDEYGDPAVRIKTWVDGFGDNGQFANICADDYRDSMTDIARALTRVIQPACLDGEVRERGNSGVPDCQVTEVVNRQRPGATLPFCAGARTSLPCWELIDEPRCPLGQVVRVCRDATCDPATLPQGNQPRDLEVSCSLTP